MGARVDETDLLGYLTGVIQQYEVTRVERRLILGLLLCIFVAAVAGYAAEDDLAKARKLLLGGKYAEAAEIYAPSAAKVPAAALGLARCLVAEGKLDEALKRLSAAAADHAELQAELARLAFERGAYQQAKQRAEQSMRLDRNQLLAQWVLAELDRTAGRLDQADRAYRRLVDYYNSHEVKQAESLRWIGLAAAQNARWNRISDQFDFLVNELYPDALKLEPGFWPAHYEAGMLFLEKHNQADALREFRAALELNAQAAEVHAALGQLALDKHDIEQAEKSVARALEINPRLLVAWQLKADLLWANFQARETLALLEEKALPLNPVDEETLGRMAACFVLLDGLPEQGKPSRFSRLVEKVGKQNPHAGAFYFTLAAQLEERNKQSEAEVFFREAIRVMPRQIGPQAHLGMLYMRIGREAEARKLLKDAFKADPFNVRVNNTLEVLGVLDAMETLQTERFTIKYLGKYDKLLARAAGRHLESVYPALCRQFGYEPPEKPLVEIFNRAQGHDGSQWFSARMIGLPYLGTVAASTGRLVAMASPYDPQARRQFNWARVLKHEVVHVITLQQTHFNIPHWYTEGLAVWSEGGPRPQVWNELLLERVPQGRLFRLDTLNFGFTRPNSSADWQMAYCQALLYVEYMLARSDPGCLRRLLAAYTEGLATPEAIQRVFGVSQKQFEEGYAAYLQKLVAGMTSLKHPSTADIADLRKAHRAQPNSAEAAAELAYACLRRNNDKEALELAQQAFNLQPKHPLATYVVARLRLRAAGDKDDPDGDNLPAEKTREVVEMLRACLDAKSPQPNVLSLLAALRLKAKQYDEAERLYSLGERLDPINLEWAKSLARVYLLSENKPKLSETLTRLARADGDDVASRKILAKMALERKDDAAAADWAQQALQIDLMDAEVHRLLADVSAARRQWPAAIEEYEAAIELDPKEPHQRFALGKAYLEAKQPGKARQTLEALLELTPDYPGAESLIESIKEPQKP